MAQTHNHQMMAAASAGIFWAAPAFVDPASQALLPLLVPAERLPGATARSSSAWQVAVMMLKGIAW